MSTQTIPTIIYRGNLKFLLAKRNSKRNANEPIKTILTIKNKTTVNRDIILTIQKNRFTARKAEVLFLKTYICKLMLFLKEFIQ